MYDVDRFFIVDAALNNIGKATFRHEMEKYKHSLMSILISTLCYQTNGPKQMKTNESRQLKKLYLNLIQK